VQEQLRQRAVESFLPLYETVRRWKDRCVRLEFPLFPSYVFVRIALRDRLGIQQIPSVVRFVGFNGTPTPLPENGIESLRKGLVKCVRAEPYPYLKIGRRVRIKSGPLQGMQGIVVRKKNVIRVVISLELIMRSIAVETDALDLEPLS
jgi:transcription antitermination factor NusG